ncbi:hypothetical protein SAMN05216390_102248 [Lachnospiraceae bacterium KH1T2]|nr:hypothetical protein SAMN05216390_102248 [Lachnospiraceae bacterium KH1T2]
MSVDSYEKEWYRLDNAAKIVPSSMVGADTRVFRLVCELKEEVDPELLQQALDKVLEEYSYMNCCLRKGIFWYYMDELEYGAEVKPEEASERALHALYVPGKRGLLYRVNYFGKRINLEIFHVLADGTGGFIFFQQIINEYLILKYNIDRNLLNDDTEGSSVEEKQEDAFSQFYEEDKKKSRNYIKELFPVKAYQVKGIKDPNLDEHLIEGTVSVKKMIEIAHEKGVTLGVLATSLWVEAIVKQMKRSEYKQPVVVSVPVNLRQFFHSLTTRNFFGVINVSFDPRKYDGTLESILTEIKREFSEQLTPENVQQTMNSYAALEHNIALKFLPLFIKDLSLMGIKNRMDRGITTSVSNVGKVNMNEAFVPYIEKFCSFMACTTVFLCISTFGDNMVFGITSCFEKHPTALHFFRRLRELGAEIQIATNDNDREVQ